MKRLDEKQKLFVLQCLNRPAITENYELVECVEAHILAANQDQGEWIVIDTQEKRKRYAPKKDCDEYWKDEEGWVATNNQLTFNADKLYRRRVQSQWIEGNINIVYPAFLKFNDGSIRWDAQPSTIHNCIRWFHYAPPEPPKPEMSAMERAFRAAYNYDGKLPPEHDFTEQAWSTWQKCWPIAQSQKEGGM